MLTGNEIVTYNKHIITQHERLTMTPDQVKKKLDRQGKTIKQYSEENDLNYRTVLCVLNGVNKGRRGEAHRVAVALGLKKAA